MSLGGELLPNMAEAVRRCSERLKTGLLTNNYLPMDSSERSAELAEVMGWFDVVIESSVVGVRKPDPAFYTMACDALGVEPLGVRVPGRSGGEPQAGPGHGHDHHQGGRPRRGAG